jgi:hypothetical protein
MKKFRIEFACVKTDIKIYEVVAESLEDAHDEIINGSHEPIDYIEADEYDDSFMTSSEEI